MIDLYSPARLFARIATVMLGILIGAGLGVGVVALV